MVQDQFAGEVMPAAVLAGVACIATSGLANGAKFATTSVDRVHKGDRLPPSVQPSAVQNNEDANNCVPAGPCPLFLKSSVRATLNEGIGL